MTLDGWKLWRSSRDMPKLGPLPDGGYAWESDAGRELLRNLTNLMALAVMMAAPWFLAERTGTDLAFLVVFDGLLAIHCIWLILPKRYAITRSHLWVDGFRVDWTRLSWKGWKGGNRIVLLRRGWGVFAPLPVGGDVDHLAEAAVRIEAIENDAWDAMVAALSAEE